MIGLVNFYRKYLESFGYNVSRLIPLPDNMRDGTSYLVIQTKPIDTIEDFCQSGIKRIEMSIILISETVRSYDVAHQKLKTVNQLIELLPFPTGNEEVRVHSAAKYEYEELGLDNAKRYALKLKFEVMYSE